MSLLDDSGFLEAFKNKGLNFRVLDAASPENIRHSTASVDDTLRILGYKPEVFQNWAKQALIRPEWVKTRLEDTRILDPNALGLTQKWEACACTGSNAVILSQSGLAAADIMKSLTSMEIEKPLDPAYQNHLLAFFLVHELTHFTNERPFSRAEDDGAAINLRIEAECDKKARALMEEYGHGANSELMQDIIAMRAVGDFNVNFKSRRGDGSFSYDPHATALYLKDPSRTLPARTALNAYIRVQSLMYQQADEVLRKNPQLESGDPGVLYIAALRVLDDRKAGLSPLETEILEDYKNGMERLAPQKTQELSARLHKDSAWSWLPFHNL
jgi:hypothetical protein